MKIEFRIPAEGLISTVRQWGPQQALGSAGDIDVVTDGSGTVTVREAFNGIEFVTDDGERLAVCMRDSGYQVHYWKDSQPGPSDGFDRDWTVFANGRITAPDPSVDVEELCEVMHDAYEEAAVDEGWKTQKASRKPWDQVPEANKATMRRAVRAVLAELGIRPVDEPVHACTMPDVELALDTGAVYDPDDRSEFTCVGCGTDWARILCDDGAYRWERLRAGARP